MRPMLLCAVLCLCALPAAAQTYRWIDADGKVHFTSTPPPPGAKGVQRRADPASTAPSSAAQEVPQSFALQQAMAEYPVTLYTTPGCEPCAEARKLLNARGIPFKETSVTEDAQIEELKKTIGSNSVPAMTVGRTVQKGFEEGSYQRTLDAAGYPRTGILPPRNQTEPGAVQPATPTVEPVSAPGAKRGRYSTDDIQPRRR